MPMAMLPKAAASTKPQHVLQIEFDEKQVSINKAEAKAENWDTDADFD